MGRRGVEVGSWLTTTSVVALLVGSASPATAGCVNVTATFTNPAATTIDGICITNRTFTGSVTNAGTITPLGVVIVNSKITTSGAPTFLDSGPTLVGGISIDGTSQLSSNNNTVSITGAVFTGGISNAGTITSTGSNGRGIIVSGTSTFTGGITNSGTITAVTGSGTAAGIRVVNTSTFSNGILNSGTISARSRGIVVSGGSTFSGGVSNSGHITTTVSNGIRIDSVTSFLGGVTNSGTITLNATASSGIFVGSATPGGISTFSGDIANTGTGLITTTLGSGTDNGIRVTNVGTITGNVTNSGTITSRSAAVFVSGVTKLTGGIVNSGSLSSEVSNGIHVTNFGAINDGNTNNGGTITSLNNSIYLLDGTSFAGGISNSGTLTSTAGDGIRINNVTTVAGGIANTGTIAGFSAAVSIGTVSTFSGNITNSGTISSSNGVAIFISGVSRFSADIVNSGTLSSSLSGATNGVIHVQSVSTFAGGVTNSGAINSTNLGGILIEGVSTFTGGISNALGGTIAAKTSGIYVRNVQSFGGGISNSGSISSTSNGGIDVSGGISLFSGGITNAGGATITSRQTGIFVGGLSTFSGGIVNSGSISSAVNAGINVSQNFAGVVTSFSGGITNNGTITAHQSGIHISGVSTFAGGVVNNGSIASTTAYGITVSTVSNFSGGISNTGTIVASTGIHVGTGTTFQGAIANSGNVTGLGGTAIDIRNAPNAVTISQSAGTITGAIRLSPFADVVNIFGGAISGNIVGQGSSNTVNVAPGAGNTFTYANAITGVNAVNVNSGTLLLQGTIGATLTTVNSGAALTGAGTVGPLTVNSGGTFAPGSGAPGSSMTVNGSLALQSGAQYIAFLNPASASFANVTGTATLGGATVNATFAGGAYIEKKYTILTAGSVSGTFNPVIANSNLPANFHTSLSYDATHAYLDLVLNFIPPSGGFNGNQQNVANSIVNFFNTNGSIPLVFGGLTPAGLTQLSGESATAPQQTTFDAMSQFMGVMTDPFIAGRGAPIGGSAGPTGYADETLAYAAKKKPAQAFAMFTKAPPVTPFEQRWSVWAAGFGGSQRTDGNTVLGSNDTRSSIAGTAVGVDYRISPDTLAGFALAGGGTSFSVNGLGYGRSDLFQAGAFVRHTIGPAYLTGALAYGWQDITTDRIVTVAGFDHLRAEFNANAWSGRVEGGYRFVAPVAGGVGVTPYLAGQFVSFGLPAYMEQAVAGTNQFALGYNAKTVTDARSELGVRTDKSFAVQNGIVTLRGRLAWAHDFNPDRNVLSTFQTLPGASFVVNGARHGTDSALTTGSVEWKWLNGWSAAATFEGEFSDVTSSYAGKGALRYSW